MRQIGALVLDIGGHCISAIASKINCNRKFIKKCYMIVRDSLIFDTFIKKCLLDLIKSSFFMYLVLRT